MVLFIIGAVLTFGLLGFIVFRVIKYIKQKPLGTDVIKIDKNLFILLLVTNLSLGLPVIMTCYGAALWFSWNLSVVEHICMIIGGYMFGTSIAVFFTSFTIYYYKPELYKKQRLVLRILMFAIIPFIIAGLWVMTEGFAAHIVYPLYNAIGFPGFLTTFKDRPSFKITFYGIVIVGGAMVSYFTCDHYFYKKYGKHGLLDVCFLVAFPAGIVGGRLWYCLILNPDIYLSDPLRIMTGIVDGGMAIQGGALLGIVAGVTYMLIFRRYVDYRWAADAIIPTILLAQAIGRWGNFFNCEVHGLAMNMSEYWFLPSIIKYQMQFSSVLGVDLVNTNPAMMYMPLFFIEGGLNLLGYFLIRYFTKMFNNWLPLLSRAGMYPIWYGLVRVLLEPLRTGWNTSGNGDAYTQSFITAFIMIGGGLLIIVIAYIWAFIEKKVKKLDHIKTFDFE